MNRDVGLNAMKKTAILVFPVLTLCCISCGHDPHALRIEAEEHASEIEDQVREQVQTIGENADRIKSEIDRLIAAVDQEDIQKLKNACEAVDLQLGTRVAAKYYRAFALEIETGPPSALEYLNDEIENLPTGSVEGSALTGLRRYFDAKGTLTTRDAAILVLAVALEAKFPHGRGAVFLAPFLPLLDSADTKNEPSQRAVDESD
jgi:hypothetical protein